MSRFHARLVITSALLLLPVAGYAATPTFVSYQGRVLVGTTPFGGTGATGHFKFALVNGANAIVWNHKAGSAGSAMPTSTIDLNVVNGLYSVLLGDTSIIASDAIAMAALPASVFTNNSGLKLRVWFDDGTNGNLQLAPDQQIAAVGYAMAAATTENLTLPLSATATTASNALQITQNGTGNGLVVNSSSTSPMSAIRATATGISNAGFFEITNAASGADCMHLVTNGNGSTLSAQTTGAGGAGGFSINNAANVSNAITTATNGNGAAILAQGTGLGSVGFFQLINAGSGQSAVLAQSNGAGSALDSTNTGTGPAGSFSISNAASAASGLSAQTNGTGFAAFITSTSTTNGAALLLNSNNTNGSATVMQVVCAAGAGNLAVFQKTGLGNVIRFDSTGKGFFNGGTQTGGADVAEAFAVEGNRSAYEPGDVLVLSTNGERRVEKSREPYSPLVSGVHATKPGMLLTDRDIEAKMDDTVPMGVVGVIPTKVCTENGTINIGDLLVTSSSPGVAMKGTDRDKMLGATIGKAMENFTASEVNSGKGKIKVLVNVK
jgi:hypothetical protein